MSDLVQWIRTREQMAHEENVRLNADRERLLVLAPEKWEELKAEFRRECAVISAQSHRTRLECDESDDNTFRVNRQLLASGHLVVALILQFDRVIPRIICKDFKNARLPWSLDFGIEGNNVFLLEGRSGIVIPEFVVRNIMQIVS
jgi:hypothetical protein